MDQETLDMIEQMKKADTMAVSMELSATFRIVNAPPFTPIGEEIISFTLEPIMHGASMPQPKNVHDFYRQMSNLVHSLFASTYGTMVNAWLDEAFDFSGARQLVEGDEHDPDGGRPPLYLFKE